MKLIRNVITGEHVTVQSLEGYDLDEWEVVRKRARDPNKKNQRWVDGKLEHVAVHGFQRALEYPPITEFVDALYWREKGDNGPWEAYIAACDAVKAKFPKKGK